MVGMMKMMRDDDDKTTYRINDDNCFKAREWDGNNEENDEKTT